MLPGSALVVDGQVEVLAPETTTGVGLNAPPAAAGRPLTLSATAPLKPFAGVTVTVYVPLRPVRAFASSEQP